MHEILICTNQFHLEDDVNGENSVVSRSVRFRERIQRVVFDVVVAADDFPSLHCFGSILSGHFGGGGCSTGN